MMEKFSGNARIKEIYWQFPQVYRILFDDRELVVYVLRGGEFLEVMEK